jgi:uncharacterized protein
MKKVIFQQLRDIENEHQVKIVFACEAGSRATGLATENSDYDVRFFYIRPIQWYLSIHKKSDVISMPINDQLDLHGWDLHKALFLLKKSNPTLLECLHCTNVYEENVEIISIIKEAVPSFFSQKACFYHYLKIATSNYQIVLNGNTSVKQYLNVIRPLLMCLSLEKEHAFPPLELQRLIHLCERDIKEQIKELILLKKGQNGTPNYSSINTFIEMELNRLATIANQLSEGKENDSRRLDEIFTFALKNVWNINF